MRLPEGRTRFIVLPLAILGVVLVVVLVVYRLPLTAPGSNLVPDPTEIVLPEPRLDSDHSLEQTLLRRRSVREYGGEALTIDEVSQLLWAAQGITYARGFRTAPSAGATYPLETYLVVGNVIEVAPGVYRYDPARHRLEKVLEGDVRAGLTSAALGQRQVGEGAASIVFAAIYERTTQRYGERGIRYVHMEAGHAAQNVYLQAVALDLGTVVIGAFRDDEVSEVLGLPADEEPLYVIPVGHPA